MYVYTWKGDGVRADMCNIGTFFVIKNEPFFSTVALLFLSSKTIVSLSLLTLHSYVFDSNTGGLYIRF